MKDWLKSNYKTIVLIAMCVFWYIILSLTCSDYISFEEDEDDFNIKVARLYFITLPIASVLPVILYEIVKFIRKKNR